MKTPPFLTRFFGNPVVALIMGAWFFHMVADWYQGQPSVPETFFASGSAVFSLIAWRRMRVHHAWRRQWSETGQAEAGTPARIAGGSLSRWRSALMVFLPVLCLVFLLMAAGNAGPDTLPLLRLLALGCLGWLVAALVRKFRKHGGGRVGVATAKTEAPAIVAWVIGPAGSAPSRGTATANLPDYALAVMGLRRRN